MSAKRPCIVVVTYRCPEMVRDCLRSLIEDGWLDARSHADSRAQVVVVDMDSGDDTVRVVREEFPGAKLIPHEENLGFAGGTNIGLAHSEGGHALLLNPDTVAPPGSIAALLDYLEAHPEAGAVGPRLICHDGSPQISTQRFPSLRTEFARQCEPIARRIGVSELGDEQPSAAGRVDWISGACLLIRDQTLEQVGPLDDGFFLYFEETDWCRRASSGGWEVHHLPNVDVVHVGGQSAAASGEEVRGGRSHRHFVDSRKRYFKKHHGALTALAVEGVHQVRSIWRGTLRALGRRERAA